MPKAAEFNRFNPDKDKLNYPFTYGDKETAPLKAAMRRKADLTVDDLRRIALWKLDRVLNVPESVLLRLRQLADDDTLKVDSPTSRTVLDELTGCDGIGLPMASTILKFLRPDVFPIIDRRAYRALYGKKLHEFSHSVDLYLRYANDVASLAASQKMSLDQVDEQLYCFDESLNGKL